MAACTINWQTAKAQSVDELRAKSQSLQQQIDSNDQQVKALADAAATIQEKMNQLEAQATAMDLQISSTTARIGEINRTLKDTVDKLNHQKELLRFSIKALYMHSGASSVELLASSDSFSQFINSQTYLEKLKDRIQDSSKKVIDLNRQMFDEQIQQEEMLKRQEALKASLLDVEKQQADLLVLTKGEQAKYEQVVADLEAKQRQVEAELTAKIRSGTLVSEGRVARGDMIGRIGMTGFTFGPHLHFEIRDANNNTINPLPNGGTSLVNGYSWPVQAQPKINQVYGCVAPYGWYYTKCNSTTSFHPGIDVNGGLGTPVIAPADGEIIVNANHCDGYGHKIIIRHDDGYLTYFAHLQGKEQCYS